jgi:hypothetical protein
MRGDLSNIKHGNKKWRYVTREFKMWATYLINNKKIKNFEKVLDKIKNI